MTRLFRVLGLTFVTVCVLGGGVLAVVSAAAPMQLPGFLGALSAGVSTSLAGKLSVSGGASISCKSDTDQFLFGGNNTVTNLGYFTIDFKGCTQGGEECFTLGDTGGVTLVAGEWHLVLELLPTKHVWLILFLLNLPTTGVHVECPHSTVHETLITGDVLGETMPQENGTSTVLYEVLVHATSTAQEYTSYENNAGTLLATSLRVAQEGGATKAGWEEAGEDTLRFAHPLEISQ